MGTRTYVLAGANPFVSMCVTETTTKDYISPVMAYLAESQSAATVKVYGFNMPMIGA